MPVSAEDHDWDVFISYSRDDSVQAGQLKNALDQCTTASGTRPRVYLDTSASGTPAGADWRSFIETALSRSRRIVALYSTSFFAKNICQFELHQALALNSFKQVPFIPLLIDAAAESRVPYYAGHINWLPVTKPGWIDELRAALDLRLPGTRSELRFEGPIDDVPVNRSLPHLRVKVIDPEGSAGAVDRVSIAPDPATAPINGSLTARVEHGVASFTDLTFSATAPQVRLVASATGCEPVTSQPFAVRPPAPISPAPGVERRVVVDRSGRVAFLPGSDMFTILNGLDLSLHTADGEETGTARLRERPCLRAEGAGRLAVADWSGRVVVAGFGGAPVRTVDLDARTGAAGLSVPGSLAFHDATLYIGMWNGTVWALPADGEPVESMRHPAGVQMLGVDADTMLVGGLDGDVAAYRNGRREATFGLEPVLLHASLAEGGAVIVGERSVHRLDLAEERSFAVEMPVGKIVDVLDCGELTALLDERGDGVVFDRELAVRTGFHTAAGARMVCGAEAGRSLVFAYPDGSHVLMREGRIGFASDRSLSLSSDGATATVSDGSRTTVVPTTALLDEEAAR